MMATRAEAISVATEAWRLRLKTAADPERQLRDLSLLLGRDPADPGLRAGLEVRSPGWSPPEEPMRPTVFENTTYTLSVGQLDGWEIESVRHPILKEVEDSLDCDGGVWRGTIRTGNDLGWYPLEIVVRQKGGDRSRIDRIAWQVWPSKLDYASDLSALTASVKDAYPLWLFKFHTATAHDAGRARERGERFLLLWAAQFQALKDELEQGCRIVVQNPHAVLDSQKVRRRADQFKGRLTRSCEERVAAGLGRPELRHDFEIWRSSRDTPENRFVAHVLDKCVSGLERFREAVDRPGLSPSFMELLAEWISSLRTIRSDPLFKGLSEYAGMPGESLVLHHRTGYSKVYRAWIELRHYLDFFSHPASARIGMRSISELYEIWCFLEVRRLLSELPGFAEARRRAPRWRRGTLERELENGQGAAFEFLRESDGLRIALSHEPVFSRRDECQLTSLTVAQRPDIVLEANWPGTWESPARKLLWIFDAKYRIKTAEDNGGWNRDEGSGRESDYLVPPDAIDQMHRYRDSILLSMMGSRSRPVVSAFALYPGRFDQGLPPQANPYFKAIAEAGIGAFPLVPGDGGCAWLKAYLVRALEAESPAEITRAGSVRIPVSGLEYPEEDVLLVFLSSNREPGYLDRFRNGYAGKYHIYVNGGPKRTRFDRVKYLAAIDVRDAATGTRKIHGVYLITEKRIVPRKEVDREAAGTGSPARPEEDCQLLELGRYLQLATPLPVPQDRGNWFRYASLHRLFEAREFAGLWTIADEAD